eukprot:6192387-Pleurochrysis_carterae.AAC.1
MLHGSLMQRAHAVEGRTKKPAGAGSAAAVARRPQWPAAVCRSLTGRLPRRARPHPRSRPRPREHPRRHPRLHLRLRPRLRRHLRLPSQPARVRARRLAAARRNGAETRGGPSARGR